MNIIEELFYGNIAPNISHTEDGSEYDRQIKTVDKIEEKLLSLLDGKEKSMFIDYINAQSSINGITAEEKFVFGFKLGTLLMIESLHSADKILCDKYE